MALAVSAIHFSHGPIELFAKIAAGAAPSARIARAL
jgi:hypothetical protein